jgi:hypothetical protein
MTRSRWPSSPYCVVRIAATCCAVLLSVLLACPATSAAKPKGHQSITWAKFQASGPELKQIGTLVGGLRNARP